MLPLAVFVAAVVVLGIAVLVALLVSGGSDDDTEATPTIIDTTAVTIDIEDFKFNPANVSVPAGAMVKWVNHDVAPHDATDNAGDWATNELGKDDADTVTFGAEGEYPYKCSIHPYMKGTITVR